jgi:hypothetical protein
MEKTERPPSQQLGPWNETITFPPSWLSEGKIGPLLPPWPSHSIKERAMNPTLEQRG